MIAFWTIATGAVVAITCALLGSFLVVRKMAMIGDAISHAVLPGLVIAFLIAGSRESLPMVLGASAFGMLATFLIQFFHRRAGLANDASIGVNFTFLFAIGVILISLYARQVDLDQDCVLYGEIAYVSLDQLTLPEGTRIGPRDMWRMLACLAAVVLCIAAFYHRLLITSFDPHYARATGLRVDFWHYLLMALVSLTTVLAFDAVGAILVVAFLTVPPAAALLVSKRLTPMLLLAALFGSLSAALGYGLAAQTGGSIAGAMAVVAGLIWIAAYATSTIRARNKPSPSDNRLKTRKKSVAT
jgi:manganese/zinc/iron transport system permease protein